MKVLHISTSDRVGGASIGAFRLSEAMREAGIDSQMLVLEKQSDTDMVVPIKAYKFNHYEYFRKFKKELGLRLTRYIIKPRLNYSTAASHVHHLMTIPLVQEADVIYIHWVQETFLSIRDVRQILKTGKPVYMYLHDMWSMTGGCHYSMGCDGYVHRCEQCPMIGRQLMHGMSQATLRKKLKMWRNQPNLHVIAPSRWMYDCARESAVFHQQPVFLIPNTLNDRVFRVMDKRDAREVLGLPQDRPLVLFGAVGGTANLYKGWDYADRLMQRMGTEADMVVFGSTYQSAGYTTHAIGKMHDEFSLACLYNAIDVFISPTQAECFGLTIAESISCGTKAVVFNVGGVSDIVTHQDNGYLAEPNNVDDLERGVRWALGRDNDDVERRRLHEGIRAKFAYPVVAAQHLRLIEAS